MSEDPKDTLTNVKRKRDEVEDPNPGPNKKRKTMCVTNTYNDLHFIHVQKHREQNTDSRGRKKTKSAIVKPDPNSLYQEIRDFLQSVRRVPSRSQYINAEVQYKILDYMESFENMAVGFSLFEDSSQSLHCLRELKACFLGIQDQQDLSLEGEGGRNVIMNFPKFEFSKIDSLVDKSLKERGARYVLECIAYSFDKYRKSPLFDRREIEKHKSSLRSLVEEIIVAAGRKYLNLQNISKKLLYKFIEVETELERLRTTESRRIAKNSEKAELEVLSKSLLILFSVFLEYYTLKLDDSEDRAVMHRFLNDVILVMTSCNEMTPKLLQKFLNSLSMKNVRGFCVRLFILEYLIDRYDLQNSQMPYEYDFTAHSLKKVWYEYLDVNLEREDLSSIEKFFVYVQVAISMNLGRMRTLEETKFLCEKVQEKLNRIYTEQLAPKYGKKKEFSVVLERMNFIKNTLKRKNYGGAFHKGFNVSSKF